MKCVICGKKIGATEPRAYVRRWNSITGCQMCACDDCQAPFDRLIDVLPVDESGCSLNVSRFELEALKLGTDRKRLEKRLQAAWSILEMQSRRDFGHGRFDFNGRRLLGDNGMVLQWQTRNKPDEPITYQNQQTVIGIVSYSTKTRAIIGNKIIIVTGCRKNCPYTRHYDPNEDGETKGCQYAYGTLPEQGVAEWCPLHDEKPLQDCED